MPTPEIILPEAAIAYTTATPPRPISPYKFVGKHRDLPGLESAIEGLIERPRVEGTVFPTLDEIDTVVNVHEGLTAATDEIGVNVRERLSGPSRYHFFATQEDFDESVRKLGLTPVGGTSSARYLTAQGILLARNDYHDLTSTIAHEAGHSISHQVVKPVEAPGSTADSPVYNFHSSVGYHRSGERSGLNEFTTDMLMQEALRKIEAPQTTYSYVVNDALGSAVIHKAAEQYGDISPRQLSRLVIKGMLDGDLTGLRLIGKALGPDNMRSFMKQPTSLSWDEGIDVATKLDLPRAVELLENAKAGRDFDPFNW